LEVGPDEIMRVRPCDVAGGFIRKGRGSLTARGLTEASTGLLDFTASRTGNQMGLHPFLFSLC
jgi:hypothetical protein